MSEKPRKTNGLEIIGIINIGIIVAIVWWFVAGWIAPSSEGIPWAPFALRFLGYGFFLGIATRLP